MKTKRIDFDIALARKIQAGEVPGYIRTSIGNSARIICWDREGCDHYPIVALVYYNYEHYGEYCFFFDEKGKCIEPKHDELIIEIPYEIKKFQPFEKVLVRDCLSEKWHCTHYSHFDNKIEEHMCTDTHNHIYCIPYEGNEHLVGTTDEPKEDKE